MGRRVYRAEKTGRKKKEKKNPTTTSDYINVILCVCVVFFAFTASVDAHSVFCGTQRNIVLPSYVIQVLDFLDAHMGRRRRLPRRIIGYLLKKRGSRINNPSGK